MKHLFIINPAAGKKMDVEGLSKQISNQMQKSDSNWEIYVTKAPMDACGKIRKEALKNDELRVYACGGDGTLNECVNGAANNANVSVTHYPMGTGNDFIRTFGSEDVVKFKSLEALVGGIALPLDLIECNERYGVNICSVGTDACVAADVHKYSTIPFVSGIGGYVISLTVNFIKGVTHACKLFYDGGEFQNDYTIICACNGRYYGGGFNPVPDAEPDDGVLDFLVVSKTSRLKFLRLVQIYAKGGYKKLSDIITHYRGTDMRIESQKTMFINLDGEIIKGKCVYFRLHHKALRFIFPSNSEFLRSRMM